jgi:hypothetical protein
MEVSGQLHAPAALPPGKESLVPIGWEAGNLYGVRFITNICASKVDDTKP